MMRCASNMLASHGMALLRPAQCLHASDFLPEAACRSKLVGMQAYVVCELPRKLDLLWAFIKQHLRSRTLVFVSTCKQVTTVSALHCGVEHLLFSHISSPCVTGWAQNASGSAALFDS